MSARTAASITDLLRLELAQGDRMIANARPVLRHLLADGEHVFFNDEVVARIRGTISDIARQLLFAQGEAARARDLAEYAAPRASTLVGKLLGEGDLVAHVHAVVLEADFAERLRDRAGFDPVLSPVLQDLAASNHAELAEAAMQVLAAQARFFQQQRRMALPLGELPADLLHRVLQVLGELDEEDAEAADKAARILRQSFNERTARTGHIAHLLSSVEGDFPDGLSLRRAGLSIFISALAMASGQSREMVVLSFADRQFARLALMLRGAGLDMADAQEQFHTLHHDIAFPQGLSEIGAAEALKLLDAASIQAVD